MPSSERKRQSEPGEREPAAAETPQGMALPAIGALYASLVIAVVVALLDTEFGQGLADKVGAPVQTMVAAPVLAMALVVFVASVLALVLPAARRRLLGVAGIVSWLIPAWLVIAGVLLACVSFALDRLD